MTLKDAIESGKKFKRGKLKWMTKADGVGGLSFNDVCADDWIVKLGGLFIGYACLDSAGRHDGILYTTRGLALDAAYNEIVVKLMEVKDENS